mmetsp:Transcript_626/g.1605  ORF Transcript_626/g.1605 Transcript_626/m.1605 type:complete len:476 (+) Transcript_626:507-1934(+)
MTSTTIRSSTLLLLTMLASSACTAEAFSFQSPTQQQQQQKGQQRQRQFVESDIDVIRQRNTGSSTATTKTKKKMTVTPIKKDTTKLGTLTVPTVGIGTISWSSNSFFDIENDDLAELVDGASEMTSKINSPLFFDTAERYGSHTKTALGMGYGETEKMIRMFVDKDQNNNDNESNSNNENPVVVATKFTPLPWRTTAKSVVEACEQSCKNLGVDSIDLYQVHMPDIVQPFRFLGQAKSKDSIYWDGLAECYHRGLVKNIGVCNYGPTLVEECQKALAARGVPLASNQIGYSLLGRHNGAQETLDKCNELGVKVLAYYPFAMGLLTGKYTTNTKSDGQEVISPLNAADASLFKNKKTGLERKDLARYAFGDGVTVPEGGIQPLLATMSAIAERKGKTVSQIALNYIISKGAIPIPGCNSSSQLEDNFGAMGWRLTPTEIKRLELEADKLGFGFDGAGFKRTNEKFVGYGVERWTLD